MSRYTWGSHTVYFDYTNYSYISGITAYYNDGTVADDIDLTSLLNKKEANKNQNYAYDPAQHQNKSVTFVVTYTAPNTRAVYTRINNSDTGKPLRMALTCPGVDYKNIFSTYNSDPTNSQLLNENINPLTSNSTGLRLMVADANTLKYALTDAEAAKDSVSISNVHIYRLNLEDGNANDEITSEFDGKINIRGSHDSWNGDQYLEIDVSGNDSDLYVSFDVQYYNVPVRIQTSGAHTDSISVTAKDNKGRIGEYASVRPNDSDMTDSFTLSVSDRYAEKWMYSDASYIIRSSGDQKLSQASLYYHDKTQNKWVTSSFSSADNGKTIEVTIPKEIDYKDYASRNTLTVTFEPIDTKKAQVYIAQNSSDASFTNLSSFVKVSTFDNSDRPSQWIFQENSTGIQSYSSLDFKQSSNAPNSSSAYQIKTGAKVKVEFTFDPSTAGSKYNSLSDDIKALINSRIEFKGFKISSMSGSTPGAVLWETSGDVKTLTFTMPSESDIRIEPVFHDHIHAVNIIANDKNASNQNYRIDNSTRGSATLTAKNNTSKFNSAYWHSFNDTYNTTSYFTDSWAKNRTVTVDGTSYTLTVTPKSDNGVQRYRVKGVSAYQYTKTSTPSYTSNPSRNYIYISEEMPSASTWIAYDASGNVTNTPLDGVVGALSDPDSNGTVTCDVTLPYDMDKNGSIGNILLYIEFEEIEEASVYSQFKYEINQPEGASTFKPKTVIKYENSNIEGISADYDITDGKDCKVVYYDTTAEEADRRTVDIALGNTGTQSAFYYTNLVYNLTSYDGTTVNYGSFRYFKDSVTVIDNADGKLADVIDTSAIAPSAFYPANTYKACSTTIFTLKVPKTGGLKITCTPQETYVPVSVLQYVVDDAGEIASAGDGFSAAVSRYTSNDTIDDFVRNKYFTESFIDDYYSNLTSTEGYTDSFTVSGGTEAKHNMALNSNETGYYINPASIPEGYEIAAIECSAYDRDGNKLEDNYSYSSYDSSYSYSNRPASINKSDKGYRIRVNSGSQGYSRSWRQEVKVYYSKTAKLTVHQHLNEALSDNNVISTVTLSNQEGALTSDAFLPYIDNTDSTPFESSISISARRDNHKAPLTDTEYSWEKAVGVNKGTLMCFSVATTATRSISDVRVYKIVNGEETNVSFRTVSGTGSAGATTVYQINDAAAVGDDIHIDITYAVQTTLRVKVRMLNNENSETDNNPSQTKATP